MCFVGGTGCTQPDVLMCKGEVSVSYINSFSSATALWPDAKPRKDEEAAAPAKTFEPAPVEQAPVDIPANAAPTGPSGGGNGKDGGSSSLASNGSAVDEFLKFARMSPAEQVRAMYLEEQGMTEDSLKALPPEERTRIENEIANRIEHEVRTAAESPAQQNIRLSVNASYTQSMQRMEQQEQDMWMR